VPAAAQRLPPLHFGRSRRTARGPVRVDSACSSCCLADARAAPRGGRQRCLPNDSFGESGTAPAETGYVSATLTTVFAGVGSRTHRWQDMAACRDRARLLKAGWQAKRPPRGSTLGLDCDGEQPANRCRRLALELTPATTGVKAELTSPAAARASPSAPKKTSGEMRCRRPRNTAPASASQGDEQAQPTHCCHSGFPIAVVRGPT